MLADTEKELETAVADHEVTAELREGEQGRSGSTFCRIEVPREGPRAGASTVGHSRGARGAKSAKKVLLWHPPEPTRE